MAEDAEPRDRDPAGGLPWWAWLIASTILLYLAVFLALLLDELVFRTRWANKLPHGAIEALRIVYAPFIWLVKLIVK